MPFANHSKLAGALALSLGLALGACGGMPTNKSLYSVNQPVVERNNYTFDVQSSQGGLSIADQQRLDGWFEALELGYGDRVSIDDPLASDAVLEAGRDETGDGRHDGQNAIGCGAGAERQPDGEANQHIAEDSQTDRLKEPEVQFALSDLQGRESNRAGAELKLTTEVNQNRCPH